MREELYVERRERERERAVAQALTEGLLPRDPAAGRALGFSMRYQPQSDEAAVGATSTTFPAGRAPLGRRHRRRLRQGLDAARQTAWSSTRSAPTPANTVPGARAGAT
jgi:hypothetical protein